MMMNVTMAMAAVAGFWLHQLVVVELFMVVIDGDDVNATVQVVLVVVAVVVVVFLSFIIFHHGRLIIYL